MLQNSALYKPTMSYFNLRVNLLKLNLFVSENVMTLINLKSHYVMYSGNIR